MPSERGISLLRTHQQKRDPSITGPDRVQSENNPLSSFDRPSHSSLAHLDSRFEGRGVVTSQSSSDLQSTSPQDVCSAALGWREGGGNVPRPHGVEWTPLSLESEIDFCARDQIEMHWAGIPLSKFFWGEGALLDVQRILPAHFCPILCCWFWWWWARPHKRGALRTHSLRSRP